MVDLRPLGIEVDVATIGVRERLHVPPPHAAGGRSRLRRAGDRDDQQDEGGDERE